MTDNSVCSVDCDDVVEDSGAEERSFCDGGSNEADADCDDNDDDGDDLDGDPDDRDDDDDDDPDDEDEDGADGGPADAGSSNNASTLEPDCDIDRRCADDADDDKDDEEDDDDDEAFSLVSTSFRTFRRVLRNCRLASSRISMLVRPWTCR